MWEKELPKGFVYELSPIDWWTGWATVDGTVRVIQESHSYAGDEDVAKFREELQRIVDHAKQQISARSGWEGDIRQGPFVAGLPPDDQDPDSEVMVALKQSNNGTVYVWSPFELTWLSEFRARR